MFTVSRAILWGTGHLIMQVTPVGNTTQWFDVHFDPKAKQFTSTLRNTAGLNRVDFGTDHSCTDVASTLVAWQCTEDPVAEAATLAGQIFANLKPAHAEWRKREAEVAELVAFRNRLRAANEILPSDNV
jgi:hypothetical protein